MVKVPIIIALIPKVSVKFQNTFPIIPPMPISILFFLIDFITKVSSSTFVTKAIITSPKNVSGIFVRIMICSVEKINSSPPKNMKIKLIIIKIIFVDFDFSFNS